MYDLSRPSNSVLLCLTTWENEKKSAKTTENTLWASILGSNFQTPEGTTFICTNNSTQVLLFESVILPGKLTENTFSFAATSWGIVTGERRGMNEPIVNGGLLGDRDGLRVRLGS